MTTEGEKYCLLLAREQKIDIAAVARATAEFFDAPLADIALSLRKGHGFIASALPKVVGLEIQRRLDTLGAETVLLPTSALQPLPHPSTIRDVELLEDRLAARERVDAEPLEVLYGQIMFLSVCQVARPQSSGESRTPGSRNFRDTMHKFNPLRTLHDSISHNLPKSMSRVEIILNAFTRKPHEYLKMPQHDLNYRGLGEKKSETARHNFRSLLETLMQKAPAAYVTMPTRQFLGGAEPKHITFPDMAEVNRYHAWLLNVLGSR